MNLKPLLFGLTIWSLLALAIWFSPSTADKAVTGAPPNGIAESEVPTDLNPRSRYPGWQRPDVPPTVGLQIGHLENELLPEELAALIGNTGAQFAGYTELDINTDIAYKTKAILENRGVTVHILPATVPPGYWADVFLAIHADGSEDWSTSGYKFARPWRDFTGHADDLVASLDSTYAAATGLPFDPNITRNMRGYYAFAWWRYQHAIHPMTTAAIAETGFVTSANDRQIIVYNSDIPAQALADGITLHLQSRGLL